MPKVGDRVIIAASRVGAQRREGSFLGMTGRLIRVRWADGTESLLSPGAGAVTFEPRGGGKAADGAKAGGSPKGGSKPAVRSGTIGKTAGKAGARKAAPKKKR